MHIYNLCPDCMRSDWHHPLCPSEDLPLKGEYLEQIDEMDLAREQREKEEQIVQLSDRY